MSANPGNQPNQGSTPPDPDSRFRFNLARSVVIFVFSVTGAVAATAIIVAAVSSKEAYAGVKDVLSITFPVLSAWAGTVFAFYFGRENFESAAKHTSDLVRQLTSEQKLASISFQDVMIRVGGAPPPGKSGPATTASVTGAKPENAIKLKADLIDALLDKNNRERLPILDEQGRIKYMVHRSLIDKFLVSRMGVPGGKNTADLTLQDMLDDPAFGGTLKGSFRTTRLAATLAEAKALMDSVAICSDVFATEDGTVGSKVVGWVTNVIIEEEAKL